MLLLSRLRAVARLEADISLPRALVVLTPFLYTASQTFKYQLSSLILSIKEYCGKESDTTGTSFAVNCNSL